jgi:uncharacterized phage protein (TIGR01671 family)
MREFKFRAWSDETKMMYHSHRPNGTNNPMWSYDSVFRANNPKTNIMQYTGTKDTNGKEIYEGDIISGHTCGGHFTCGNITMCGVVEYVPPRFVVDGHHYWDAVDGICVIGNIYENPELLEVVKE